MNMKPVEMQIAIPRTSEAGRIQNEGQQRPHIDQNLLAGENIKNSEHDRKRSSGVDESAHNTTVRREGNGSSEQQEGQAHSNHEDGHAEQGKEQMAEHPYKGKHIDFSL
ncbi:hypothetical protein D3C76_15750 [compost metagenome]